MRIETERLILRRWRPEDVTALSLIQADPAVVQWLPRVTLADAAVTIERMELHWETHGYGRFAVEERRSGSLVGRVGVMQQPEWVETTEKNEVGWLVAPERWGEGLATEAAAGAIADAFDRVGLERIVSWTLPQNVASRRVMAKCGLRYRGVTDWKGREHVWYDVRAGGSDTRDGSRLGGPPTGRLA